MPTRPLPPGYSRRHSRHIFLENRSCAHAASCNVSCPNIREVDDCHPKGAVMTGSSQMVRRQKQDVDYVFYELTRSICPECRRVIDAQILLRDNKVYMRKRCPE